MRQRLPGAHPDGGGTTFVAWSTRARTVEVRLVDEQRRPLRTNPSRLAAIIASSSISRA